MRRTVPVRPRTPAPAALRETGLPGRRAGAAGARDRRTLGRRPRGRGTPEAGRGREQGLAARLREDGGAAVAEFPLVAVLIVMIALLVIQAALIVHTRNTLVDAAVQGAHHAALAGSTPQDGADRAERLVDGRFGRGLDAEASAVQDDDGTIRVQVSATLPLVGLIGPAGALSVEGRAVDEEAW